MSEDKFYKQAIKSTVSALNDFIASESTESDDGAVPNLRFKRLELSKSFSQRVKANKSSCSLEGKKSVYKNAKTSKAVK